MRLFVAIFAEHDAGDIVVDVVCNDPICNRRLLFKIIASFTQRGDCLVKNRREPLTIVVYFKSRTRLVASNTLKSRASQLGICPSIVKA